jgi:hypothetical protein
VRVFSVPYIGTAVPPEGSHDYSLLDQSLTALACNDVFRALIAAGSPAATSWRHR